MNQFRIVLSASLSVLVFTLLYQVGKVNAAIFPAPTNTTHPPPLTPPAKVDCKFFPNDPTCIVSDLPLIQMKQTMPAMSNLTKSITHNVVSPIVINSTIPKENNTLTHILTNSTQSLPSAAHNCPDGSVADANASCVT